MTEVVEEINEDKQVIEDKETNEEKRSNIVRINESGKLIIRDQSDAFKVATVMLRAKMVPRGYDTPYQVMAAFQAGSELGMQPYQSLTCLAMINGTPALHTEGPKSLVDASGLLESFEEWFFDENGDIIHAENNKVNLKKPFGSYTKMSRKGVKGFKELWYSLDDARDAGLWIPLDQRNQERKKKKKPWDIHTNIMLQRRARSFVMKTLFADILKGTSIAEYDFDALPEKGFNKDYSGRIKDVTPEKQREDELASL